MMVSIYIEDFFLIPNHFNIFGIFKKILGEKYNIKDLENVLITIK